MPTGLPSAFFSEAAANFEMRHLPAVPAHQSMDARVLPFGYSDLRLSEKRCRPHRFEKLQESFNSPEECVMKLGSIELIEFAINCRAGRDFIACRDFIAVPYWVITNHLSYWHREFYIESWKPPSSLEFKTVVSVKTMTVLVLRGINECWC